MNQPKQEDWIIKIVDMEEDMVNKAKDVIIAAMDAGSDERQIAAKIKTQFDTDYGKIWHCVVGKSFGAFGTHETKNFIYVYYKQTAIQLWKCGYIYEKKDQQQSEK